MREVLAGHVEQGAMPGLIALVVRHGRAQVEVIGTKAFGDTEPMQRDAIFRIARSEEHTSELQSHRYLPSFPTRRSPDLIALVVRQGRAQVEVIGTKAFGDPEPMQRDAIFRIASLRSEEHSLNSSH